MSILYPVAPNAEAALNRPLGRAAREREARGRAKGEVRFVTEETGPAFQSREAALDAWKGRLDEDRSVLPPEDRYCALREVIAPEDRRRRRAALPVEPAFAEGRRWPEPPPRPRTVWRLSVSYWKVVDAEEAKALEQARRLRRAPQAESLERDDLRALSEQPLRPFKPQQALDIGLFEFRPPEAPDRIIPDE
jgi:hypothetical protein